MPFIQPLKREDLPELEETFQGTEGFLGFLPNDVLTMAYMPEATKAFMDFCLSLYANAKLPPPLLLMIGMMASAASGCRYCAAHNANKLHEEGMDAEKIAAMWAYETDPRFTEAERAALDFARAAAQSPSAVTAEHYTALRKFYDDREVVEILFIICQFGFWNRWNDAVGTELEETPRNFAVSELPEENWQLGKHA